MNLNSNATTETSDTVAIPEGTQPDRNDIDMSTNIDSDDDSDAVPDLIDVTATTVVPPILEAPAAESKALLNEGRDKNNKKPCPVTILSGFLGSGKTTLIQYILRDPNHKKRIAVIENEFGGGSGDALDAERQGLSVETLIARDGVDPTSDSLQDLIELPNGCICCTVKDSLVETLENLISKKDNLDYIIIEASGMANPGPIASVFWLDDALESRLQLDGIVTVVDATHILEQLQTTEEAAQQIAYADRILINKIDLLDNEPNNENYAIRKKQPRPDYDHHHPNNITNIESTTLDDVTQALRKLHPTAPFQTTTYSQVPDLDWILNANCFGGSERLEGLDAIWNDMTADINATSNTTLHKNHPDPHSNMHSHSHNHDHDHGDDCRECNVSSSLQKQQQQQQQQQHRHTDAVTTLAFQNEGSVTLSKLNQWLADILWPHQDEHNTVLMSLLENPSKKEAFLQKTKTTKVMEIFRMKGIVSVLHPVEEDMDMDSNNNNTNEDDVDDDDDDHLKHHCDAYVKKRDDLPDTMEDPQRLWIDRRRYIVQAVHDLWEVHPGSSNLDFDREEPRISKIIIIGKHLQAERLEEGFRNCFV